MNLVNGPGPGLRSTTPPGQHPSRRPEALSDQPGGRTKEFFRRPTTATTTDAKDRSMRYHLHQGSFQMDWPYEDHSSNSLVITNPETNEVLNIAITRDRLDPGENLEESIQRQQKILAKRIKGYAELSRTRIRLENSGLEGLQMEVRSKQEGYTISQFQTVIMLPNGADMLIATVAIPGPLTDEHRQFWGAFVNSFNLAEYTDS